MTSSLYVHCYTADRLVGEVCGTSLVVQRLQQQFKDYHETDSPSRPAYIYHAHQDGFMCEDRSTYTSEGA